MNASSLRYTYTNRYIYLSFQNVQRLHIIHIHMKSAAAALAQYIPHVCDTHLEVAALLYTSCVWSLSFLFYFNFCFECSMHVPSDFYFCSHSTGVNLFIQYSVISRFFFYIFLQELELVSRFLVFLCFLLLFDHSTVLITKKKKQKNKPIINSMSEVEVNANGKVNESHF